MHHLHFLDDVLVFFTIASIIRYCILVCHLSANWKYYADITSFHGVFKYIIPKLFAVSMKTQKFVSDISIIAKKANSKKFVDIFLFIYCCTYIINKKIMKLTQIQEHFLTTICFLVFMRIINSIVTYNLLIAFGHFAYANALFIVKTIFL